MSDTITIPAPGAPSGSRLGNVGFAIGIAICGLVVLMALVGNLVVPHDPWTQDLNATA